MTGWLGSAHLDLDFVGDAAEDGVVARYLLQEGTRDVLVGIDVGGEARDEALPGHGGASSAHTVQPEGAVLGTQDVRRTDRGGHGRHPGPVAAEGMEGVLHDRHRVELDDLRLGRLVLLHRGVVVAEMGFEEGDVPAPADAAVAAIGATGRRDHVGVVVDVAGIGKVDVLGLGAQFVVDPAEEVGHHRRGEGAFPLGGGGLAVLVGILVHAEGDEVLAFDFLPVDDPGGDVVLGDGPDREDQDAGPPLLLGGDDPADDVVSELGVEGRQFLDDPDPEVRVGVPGDLFLLDRAYAGALGRVLKCDTLRKARLPHGLSPLSNRTKRFGFSGLQILSSTLPSGVS